MIKYVAFESLFAKAVVANILLVCAIFLWWNFWASIQYLLAKLEASIYAQAKYLLPFLRFPFPFDLLLENRLLCTHRQ